MLTFEIINFEISGSTTKDSLLRAKVPGGWLVLGVCEGYSGMTFVPDPDHHWDGCSVK